VGFWSIFSRASKRGRSANVAEERLRLELIHKRGGMTPREIEKMKRELIGVLLKYIDAEPGEIEVSVKPIDSEYQAISIVIPMAGQVKR